MTTIERYRKVALGLNLVYISLVVLVLMIVGGGILGGVIGGGGGGRGSMGTFLLALTAIGFLNTGLSVYGQILCLNVPEKVRARNVVAASVTLTILGILVSGGISLGVIPNGGSMLANLATTAGWICFLLFLRRLADYMNNGRLVDRASFVLRGSIIAWVAAILLVFVMFGGGPELSLVAGLGMLGIAVFMLILFVQYSNLVRELRLDIEDRLSGRDMAA